MSSEKIYEFTKDNIDSYLNALAKEYRKSVGKEMPAEMILIGGASVLINYGFRNMTTDIDALIHAASSMKDAINTVYQNSDRLSTKQTRILFRNPVKSGFSFILKKLFTYFGSSSTCVGN